MTVRIVSTMQQLRALEPEWSRLLALSPSRDVFLTHSWFDLWFEHFGDSCEMFVLVWEPAGKVSAIAPFVISTERRRRIAARILHFPLRESAGPLRCDMLLGSSPGAAMDALVTFLQQQRKRWDLAELNGIPLGGQTAKLLESSAQRVGWDVEVNGVAPSALYLPVEMRWEAYVSARSQHLRRRLNQERSRLNRCGQWAFRHVDVVHDLAAGLDSVRTILLKRYHVAATNTLPPEDQRILRFLERLCERFARAEMLDIRLLEIENQPAACLISLVDEQKVYPFLTKYDPAFEMASPGRAVISSLCAAALDCGYREIDFLSERDYLYRFTDNKREFVNLVLRHRGWRSRLNQVLERAALLRKTAAPVAKARGEIEETT